MNKLNYGFDVAVNYGQLFKAEYEKANIWPIKDADNGAGILWEEIDEAAKAVDALVEFAQLASLASVDHGFLTDRTETGELRACAVSAICELLQVIAVCNKYEDIFAEAPEEVDTNGVEITE